jgi:hypothetical protein
MSTKFATELTKVRGEISALKSRLNLLDSGKIPFEMAKASVDAFVDRLAGEGKPSANAFAYGDVMNKPNPNWLLEFVCWLDPEKVRDRLYAEVARCYDDGDPGIAPAQRRAEQARFERELFDLEVAEERLILRAAEAGVVLSRRGDANPAAVLEA